jgi:hypothetical protein
LGSDNREVILLPSAVNHYQKVLTHLLERDRFREARDLLTFLLGCSAQDARTMEEWVTLYGWLNGLLEHHAGDGEGPFADEPEADAPRALPMGVNSLDADDADPDESESDVLERLVAARLREDEHYGRKLMDLIRSNPPADKLLLALEQLAHLKDPELDEPLLEWLETGCRHPYVQFKAMQALRRRGYDGPINTRRRGERILVEASDVPLSMDDYPRLIQEVLRSAESACEAQSPGTVGFLEELWSEFLASVFGTSVYHQLAGMDEEDAVVWAAALHSTAGEMIGSAPDVGELADTYGLRMEDLAAWERCCQLLKQTFAGIPAGE